MDEKGFISIEYLFSIFIVLIIASGLLFFNQATIESNNNIENNTSNETNTDVEENNSTNESENTSSISEDDLINYFALEDSSITSDIDQDDRTLREKAKNAFVSIVDFIFYGLYCFVYS